MSGGRAVVAGEALVDLVPGDDGRYRPLPGGSPANVAVGLARLGVPTSMLARIGTGPFGRIVRRHLTENDVSMELAIDAAEPATLAVLSLDDDGVATYDFYAEGTSDWGWTESELPEALPADTAALCVGSIVAFREPGATALEHFLARAKVPILLDPNIRPTLIGPPAEVRSRLARLLTLAEIVKVSDEDLAWLEPSADPEDVAAEWVARGPSLVVMTQGAGGAFALTSTGVRVDVKAHPIEVVDTIGAGDAFTSALVAALLEANALRDPYDAALQHALRQATLAAAVTCGRAGADPPTQTELSTRSPQD